MVAIVWEFYANTLDTDGYVVQVQGKYVSFDKSTINAYFHIRDMEDGDEFMSYWANDFHWYKVIKLLCRPGAIWTLQGSGDLDASRK